MGTSPACIVPAVRALGTPVTFSTKCVRRPRGRAEYTSSRSSTFLPPHIGQHHRIFRAGHDRFSGTYRGALRRNRSDRGRWRLRSPFCSKLHLLRSTHYGYDGITVSARSMPSPHQAWKNACCGSDVADVFFFFKVRTYRLLIGIPGKEMSNAFCHL